MALTTQEQTQLIDTIMKQLKIQADRKREATTRRSVVINPQQLISTNPTTYGPYYFNTLYSHNPSMTFGQVRTDSRRATLVVQPYVDHWISTSGGISGFYLGVLALTSVPAGLDQHTITWYAGGKASLYKEQRGVNTSWNESYNTNEAGYLKQDAGSLETPG